MLTYKQVTRFSSEGQHKELTTVDSSQQKGETMNEISITLSLQEATVICRTLAKSDPFAMYATELVKKIDTAARVAAATPPKTAPDNDLQPPNPVVQSSEK